MIDIENEVYTRVANAVRSEHGATSITGEYVPVPSSFPHVSIVEVDNYNARLDSSDEEQYSTVTYEINIYSNKRTGKKSECKAIAQLIDKTMYSMNFRRRTLSPVPNMNDATIYRMVARYRAVTNGDLIFRR